MQRLEGIPRPSTESAEHSSRRRSPSEVKRAYRKAVLTSSASIRLLSQTAPNRASTRHSQSGTVCNAGFSKSVGEDFRKCGGEEGLSYARPLPHRRKAKDMINQIISRGGDPSQLNDGHVIVELMVPGPRVGLVIGKGGETIRGLQVGRLVTRSFAGPARHCASMVPEIRRKLISNWCCWAPTFATQVGVPIEHS